MHTILNESEQKSPLGVLRIKDNGTHITELNFTKSEEITIHTMSPLAETAFKQLNEYFSGTRKQFDLPLSPNGTDFQHKVWNELLKIPYGEVCSYGQLATRIGNPKACRAVGGANNKNPIPIIIPCHRVIGANGNLVGYSDGMEIKQFLLNLERFFYNKK